MRRLVGSLMLIVAAFVPVPAQDAATVEQRAEALRAQLRDVTDKQAQLQAREQQLDEELKPENIGRSLAGIGTTDAAALLNPQPAMRSTRRTPHGSTASSRTSPYCETWASRMYRRRAVSRFLSLSCLVMRSCRSAERASSRTSASRPDGSRLSTILTSRGTLHDGRGLYAVGFSSV